MQRSRLTAIALAFLACGGNSKPASIGNRDDNAAKPAATGMTSVVMRTQTGGIIELNPRVDPTKAMHEATDEMSAHCGTDNFAIIQEGEEAVGRDATAWRVHYLCSK